MVQQGRDLRYTLSLLGKWSWLLILVALAAGLIGYGLSRLQVPRYQASTTILIDEAPGVGSQSDYDTLLMSERRARTYAQLLATEPLLNAVIEQLKLPVDVLTLERAINVQSVRDTQLISVQVRNNDPQRAAEIANSLVNIFAEQTKQLQTARYQASKESLQKQLLGLEGQIQQLETDLSGFGDDSANSAARNRLDELLSQYRQSYSNLVQSFEQVRMAESQTTSSIVQVEPAVVPVEPISPSILLNTALATSIGLLIALGFVLLYELFDDRVKNHEKVSQQTGLPVLGVIARERRPNRARSIVKEQPRSADAEAFRVLRTNLQFASVQRPTRSLLITSPAPHEGKSGVVINLAAVIAQSGYKVIVVDADLRRPVLDKRLSVTTRGGLSDMFLYPDVDVQHYLCETYIEGVSLLPAGALPPNPAELVGSTRMGEILSQLQTIADLVLVDAPPVVPVTDAVALAQHIDAVLLVVRHNRTKQAACKVAIERLRHVGANIVGMVFNDARIQPHFEYAYLNYYKEERKVKASEAEGPFVQWIKNTPHNSVVVDQEVEG